MNKFLFIKYLLIIVDHVCFTKLVNGSINCGKIELAYSFYEKSLTEKISLNVHVYKALMEELRASKIPEKAKFITNLEKTIATLGNFSDNSNRYLHEKNMDYENKAEERKENRKISFEMNEKNIEKPMKKENFSKGKVLEERKSNYNKENKDNFNFRNKESGEPKGKSQGPPMFIGMGKKMNPPFISQKELCSMVMVNPKNL